MEYLVETAAAAIELGHAGRFETALRLLDATASDDPRIALAAAEVALECELRTASTGTLPGLRSGRVGDRLKAAEHACGAVWDVAFLGLRIDYFEQLYGSGFGPEGKDPAVVDDLRRRAGELTEQAPDRVRAGWAHMYHGLILDNVVGDRQAAPAHYAIALRAGEGRNADEAGDTTERGDTSRTDVVGELDGDDMLVWEALRHLGDHDRDAGELGRARERWERATALGAAAGKVGGTLAQQMLLAVLARDTGDEAGAVALAREVSRWAEAIGAVRQHRQAEAFLAGERIA